MIFPSKHTSRKKRKRKRGILYYQITQELVGCPPVVGVWVVCEVPSEDDGGEGALVVVVVVAGMAGPLLFDRDRVPGAGGGCSSGTVPSVIIGACWGSSISARVGMARTSEMAERTVGGGDRFP